LSFQTFVIANQKATKTIGNILDFVLLSKKMQKIEMYKQMYRSLTEALQLLVPLSKFQSLDNVQCHGSEAEGGSLQEAVTVEDLMKRHRQIP
jgi:phage gp46-like protein